MFPRRLDITYRNKKMYYHFYKHWPMKKVIINTESLKYN